MRGNTKPLLLTAGRVIVVVAAVIALSACGSKKATTGTTTTTSGTASSSAALAWAGSVCGALATWKTQVVAAGKSVTANPTKAGANQALTDTKAATNTLQSTLKGLGKPPTSVGAQAQQDLQQLKGQLQNDIAVIKRTIDTTSATALAQGASTIKATTATMRTQLAATAKQLRSLPSGELTQAFNDAPTCTSLSASSSS